MTATSSSSHIQALFVYPRNTVKVIDNANNSERDLEAVSVEKNPGLIAFMQQFHGTRHGSSGRRSSSSLTDPFASDGWCDVWDPACICPDCLWDPTGGWSEQLQCGLICGGGGGGGSYYTLSNDPAFDCAVAGYADDPDLYASCLAAGGPNGPRDILYSFIRQNARDYVWYAGNLDTVLSTQTNPVAAGAVTYSSFYNGLFDGPYYAQGSFIGDSPSWDFIDIHQYPTASFGFSQSRFTYYGPGGPVGGSLARLAHTRTGSSNLGT